MRKLHCDEFSQPLTKQSIGAEDNSEYIEVLENTAYVQISDRISYGYPPYTQAFTQVQLTGDVLAVSHNLEQSVGVNVVLINNSLESVEPTNVTIINNNVAHISLAGYTPITGTWGVRVS